MNLPALGLLYLASVVFAVRVWRPDGRLAIRDRWAILTGFMTALASFALAYALVDWVTVSAVFWFVAVFVLAIGVVGAVSRWSSLSWLAGRKSIGRAVRVAATLFISALVIGGALVSSRVM